MIDFDNNTVSLDLFKRVLKEIKNTDRSADIIDSFSEPQFKSKKKLLELIDKFNILNKNSVIAIFGCWYGSILVPSLSSRVKRILLTDLDDITIRIAKNRFFQNLTNTSWTTGDVFTMWREDYSITTLFINTACEHMPPMKTWPWWGRLQNDAYFAFQSNNMDEIKGHTNCVYSLNEFKQQLPDAFVVLFEDELQDDRGSRYTLVGKIPVGK